MSGAKPLFPQCNFNTGTVKMLFFSQSLSTTNPEIAVEELSLLECDAVYIGKELTGVSEDRCASIYRVKQPES
jgi:hypothetical protein